MRKILFIISLLISFNNLKAEKKRPLYYSFTYQGNYLRTFLDRTNSPASLPKHPLEYSHAISPCIGLHLSNKIKAEIEFRNNYHKINNEQVLFKSISNQLIPITHIGYSDTISKNLTFLSSLFYGRMIGERHWEANITDKGRTTFKGNWYGLTFRINKPIYKKIGIQLKLSLAYEKSQEIWQGNYWRENEGLTFNHQVLINYNF